MEKSLTRYIWNHTRRQQIYILIVVLVSMVPYFLSFDLPKRIVNGPIQGNGFGEPGARQMFGAISLPIPGYGSVRLFDGIDLTRMEMLYALSLVFLFLVVVNGLFKLYINTFKGRLGERLLRRIRYQLIDRILRFPPSQFKRMKGSEVSSMVKDEVEPLGGFTGDAFVQPVMLGGQALTALAFIVLQNVWLGAIAAFMVGIQAVIIPRMRRRLLVLGRERQITARELAGRVGEIVEGIGTIHAYDTSNYERADIAHRLGRIFKIRYDLYQWKFMVKFINNFLAQLTPFLFYCIGGYLALKGDLDIGQLVAVISAYKDLPGPLKELIDWDQTRQDVQVKFVQVVEQFEAENMIDPSLQALPAPVAAAGMAAAGLAGVAAATTAGVHQASPAEVKVSASPEEEAEAMRESVGPLAAVNLTLSDDSGARLVERVSVQIDPGETVAIIGAAAGGGDALAEAFARLIWPESGRVTLGGKDILELPESVVGRRLTYASSDSFFFYGSLRDNLLYGLKHAPLTEASYEGSLMLHRKWEINEAKLAGNPHHDINSDWIDYSAAGASRPEDLFASILTVLDAVQLSKDILDLALRTTIDPQTRPELAERIVEMRSALTGELEEAGLNGLVVPFEPGAYNIEATVGENLLFGTAVGPRMMPQALAKNTYFRSVIDQSGLDRILFDMGYQIAENAVELFSDLPPDHPFFQQLTFMSADDIPLYQGLMQKLRGGNGFERANETERGQMIRLSFQYIEPRHRFGLLTRELMDKIIEVRQAFHENMPEDMREEIERYDPERYLASATLMDNVLFGRISNKHADGQKRIRSIVSSLLNTMGLLEQVLDIGLDFNVGAGGKRLTIVQRQKLNLARAMIRRSDFYIFNRPLPGLDHRLQDEILRDVMKLVRGSGEHQAIVWVLSNTSLATLFERVLVFDRGLLVEDGHHEDLARKNGVFKQLVAS
ncbi:ABC transporter transmembrane domain-containing protein [Xaviernesmea oryzae]|uniref:ABC transporter transmembrane domain-containing protein n=1 Tax=Xaviernesmea oryzae TaxID=464029 RepID=UPI0008B7937C|nr:ABC transporter transmembrane domain-containing protein [Xaviernesmea oryzae]SEL98916.1 putative ABC transport system ATP-binding protein [Xaviernesmea oryzae]